MAALLLWLQAFGLTLLIEVPIVLALAPRGRRLRFGLLAVAVNLATHPLVTLIAFDAQARQVWGVGLFLCIEAAVIAAEMVLWRVATDLSWGRALLLSTATNGVSAAFGVLAGLTTFGP